MQKILNRNNSKRKENYRQKKIGLENLENNIRNL
jgi:hypothetical protein